MRTISAKYPKGQEPSRTLIGNLRLFWYIVSAGLHYLIGGRKIRKLWRARQRAGEKYYVEEDQRGL